jgi:hypothetical protein
MWKPLKTPQVLEAKARSWKCGGLLVISAVDLMTSPIDKEATTPTWHVSASRLNAVVSDKDIAFVRKSFSMQDAEEDNHEPGRARHLFLQVELEHRADCECNDTEVTYVEPDGHRWKSTEATAAERRRLMDVLWGTVD